MKRNITKLIFKKLFNNFLQGLLYLAPITITIYALYTAFKYIDGLLPFYFPGLGILAVFAGITLIGFIASTIIARPLIRSIKKIIDRLPVLKFIYGSLKDLMSAFVGQKKKFNKPVMVRMQKDAEIYKLGFITDNDLTDIGITADLVAVYLPHSYNFSGNLFIVPKENVTPLNVPSADVMKYIVSGGVIEPEQNVKK